MTLQKNDLVHLTIQDLAYGGQGVARLDGFVVFVENALPDERVTVRITKKKKNHAEGVIEAIDVPSPYRVAQPPCPVFGTCGGCTWQNFDYSQQAHWKQKQVSDTLRHIGGLAEVAPLPILASPDVWRYRNKMEFTFGLNDDGQAMLGFHRKGHFDWLLPIDECLIQPVAFDDVLAILIRYARRHRLSVYDARTHSGFLRQAVLRHSQTTGETMVVLLTTDGELPEAEALAAELDEGIGGFKGLLWGRNNALSDVARIEEEVARWGAMELSETVNGLTFRISPQSFFQTNTAAAAGLYAQTVAMAQLDAQARVLDAYCGTGAIALHAAREAGRVVGVEVITEAIWDARANALRNGIANATFIAAPMAHGLELAQHAAGGPFTHVIIDPPRGGMDKRALRGLIDLQAPVFVYVSCNPATLARDLQTLQTAGYRVAAVQPVDMFPHTYHIETIVRLERGDSGA